MTRQKIKALHINAENLFLLLDLAGGPLPDIKHISEEHWQSFSYSTVKNKPLEKTKALASCILDYNPDILMLSEVSGLESLENFNSLFLNSGYTAKLIEGNSDRGIDIGYLVKKEFPLTTHLFSHRNKTLELKYKADPEGTKHYFTRDVSELRVLGEDNTTPVLVFFLVHLKSKLDPLRIDPYGYLKREAEVKKLKEIFLSTQERVPQNCGLIICGDFNGHAEPQNPDLEFKTLFEGTGLIETFTHFKIPEEERCTHPIIYETSNSQFLHLDYFLVSENLKTHLENSGVLKYKNQDGVELPHPKTPSQKGAMASDHYPIFLELDIDRNK